MTILENQYPQIWRYAIAGVVFLMTVGGTNLAVSQSAEGLLFPIQDKAINIKLAKKIIRIPLSGNLSILTNSSGATVKSNLVGLLKELDANATEILNDLYAKDEECGDRQSISDAKVNVLAPNLIISGRVNFEKWICAKFLKQRLKTKLLPKNSTDIDIIILPRVNMGKFNVSVKVNSQDGGELADQLLTSTLGVSLGKEISEAISVYSNKYGIQFETVRFSGTPEEPKFEVLAESTLSPNDVAKIFQELAK